jgi:Fe-S-cluster containining protein
MSAPDPLEAADARLIQIAESTYAEASRRAGPHLACQAGCGQCCVSPIPINVLDAARLERGIRHLEESDPERAQRIQERARRTVSLFGPAFPGDPGTGILGKDQESWDAFTQRFVDVQCPALAPDTGRCEIYEYRPVACRIAGPPLRLGKDTLPHCHLCFTEATVGEIEAARVDFDPENYEISLLAEHGLEQTLIAHALVSGGAGPAPPKS